MKPSASFSFARPSSGSSSTPSSAATPSQNSKFAFVNTSRRENSLSGTGSSFVEDSNNNSSASSTGVGVSLAFGKASASSVASFSEDSVTKYVAGLYKSLLGGEISDRDLCEAISFLHSSPEASAPQSEVRLVEKLKMHLIYQEKHIEGKKFSELYAKLKGLPLLKNRESFIILLYELFDKEPTRTIMNNKRAAREKAQRPKPNHKPELVLDLPKLESGADSSIMSQISKLPNLSMSNSTAGRNDVGVNMERALMAEGSASGIKFPHDHGRELLTTSGGSKLVNGNHLEKGSNSVSRQSTLTNFNGITASASSSHTGLFTNSAAVEQELIKDLIYIFQGIDGTVIKLNSNAGYDIVTKAPIHPSLRLQTLRLAELGFFYKQLRSFCDAPSSGLMAQGLKHALELELQEFYRLLAIVQAQVSELTMCKLTVWMYDVLPRFDALAGMVGACGSASGGGLCSILYKYSLHGDPMIRSVTSALLSTAAKPLHLMLCQWILYGELEDPYGEFFIDADPSVGSRALWHSKYHIRKEMLPSFVSVRSGEQVLATGKNINFLKEICHHAKGYEGRGQIKGWLEASPVDCMFSEEDKILQTAIEKAYKTTSKMVLQVLIEESKLIDHLTAIKRYLLLGQGDFIQYLLELIQDELQKPASKLYAHNISAILESAIRATNAQFEPEDILSRLDTRILPATDKDLGWDVFCLDYKVHGPIGTVLTEDVMIRYNQLFNALWRIKRIEMILNTLWKDQTALFKAQRMLPEIGPVLHRSQLLISELIHFIHQTQYYIMFEATECAWDKLMGEVSKAIDLDAVIVSHGHFLQTLTSRSLLSRDNRELLIQLRSIFDSVHSLKGFLTEFEGRVEAELGSRRSLGGLKPNPEQSKAFFESYVKSAKAKIETLYTTTQDLVRSFLLVLNRQPDLTLQCLSFRLDFNEYYQFKDSRLSAPLRYQHRRLSSSAFDPTTSHSKSGLNLSFASPSITESFRED